MPWFVWDEQFELEPEDAHKVALIIRGRYHCYLRKNGGPPVLMKPHPSPAGEALVRTLVSKGDIRRVPAEEWAREFSAQGTGIVTRVV